MSEWFTEEENGMFTPISIPDEWVPEDSYLDATYDDQPTYGEDVPRDYIEIGHAEDCFDEDCEGC